MTPEAAIVFAIYPEVTGQNGHYWRDEIVMTQTVYELVISDPFSYSLLIAFWSITSAASEETDTAHLRPGSTQMPEDALHHPS